jgi:hypothetical protein
MPDPYAYRIRWPNGSESRLTAAQLEKMATMVKLVVAELGGRVIETRATSTRDSIAPSSETAEYRR